MRFVDEATITIRSGKGGNGCLSFRREKYIPKGGPDGGDGGKGGDVIFRANRDLLTLQDFRLKRVYEAKNGQGGMGQQRYGKSADDLVIEVPVGTLIYEIVLPEPDEPEAPETPETDEDEDAIPMPPPRVMVYEITGEEDWDDPKYADKGEDYRGNFVDPDAAGSGAAPPLEERLLADLTHEGQEVVAARGGRGGKGNEHFKSSTMRTPRFAQPGEAGEERRIRLELKILADAGLLGLPNAGKSTFLTAISQARPKIAAYPFTTLTPQLGVLHSDIGTRMIVADIPGLIEGAHQGQGLGHRFLKHVERTRFLVHLLAFDEIDPESDEPFAGYDLINEELAAFDPLLVQKPQLLVLNKIDLASEDQLEHLRQRAEAQRRRVHFISAQEGTGVEALVAEMWKQYEKSS